MKLDLLFKQSTKRRVSKRRIVATVQAFLTDQHVAGHLYLEILVVGPRKIKTLNRTYRSVDAPTDVLSFPMDNSLTRPIGHPLPKERGIGTVSELSALPTTNYQLLSEPIGSKSQRPTTSLGSIVICPEIVSHHFAEGRYGEISKDQSMIYVVLHGLMHLLGHDHSTDAENEQFEDTIHHFLQTHQSKH